MGKLREREEKVKKRSSHMETLAGSTVLGFRLAFSERLKLIISNIRLDGRGAERGITGHI